MRLYVALRACRNGCVDSETALPLTLLSVFSPQPRLLQEPHRFLRDPLLRPDAARDGGLDHAVHNRIRPDVWLGLPAGVEEEEEKEEERGEGSRGGRWKEVWKDPRPPAPLGVHIGAMLFLGALAFFGPSLPHRSIDLEVKKKKKISQD